MKKRLVIAAFAAGASLGLMMQPAAAKGDIAAGKEKSALCVACHAEDGSSPQPAFPRIGGQYASYLERALLDYKSGVRQNPIMTGIVAQLTEEDMANLAAYFASQKGPLGTVNYDD